MNENLVRFEIAHQKDFKQALMEIKNGRKSSHWMWYIFPQIKGLGLSNTSIHYALDGVQDAADFLAHKVLGKNIVEISSALLALENNNATSIFGKPDYKKLQSSMTLFSEVPNTSPVFQKVLDKYFDGKKDSQTTRLLTESK